MGIRYTALGVFLLSAIAEGQECLPGWCSSDGDTIPDIWDNCLAVPNDYQGDADRDGFGNKCDGDVNQSKMVNMTDFVLLIPHLSGRNPVYDLDESGRVTLSDLARLRKMFGNAPGPSAVAYITVGGGVYDGVACLPAECNQPIFNESGMLKLGIKIIGSVSPGKRCLPLASVGIPAGGPTYIWGTLYPPRPGTTPMVRCSPVL